MSREYIFNDGAVCNHIGETGETVRTLQETIRPYKNNQLLVVHMQSQKQKELPVNYIVIPGFITAGPVRNDNGTRSAAVHPVVDAEEQKSIEDLFRKEGGLEPIKFWN